MGSPIVHFELTTADPTTLAPFYEQLFGWKTTYHPEMSYGVIDTGAGQGFGGGFAKSDTPGAIIHIGVPDLEATLDAVEKLGGTIVMPITVVPKMVTFFMFKDPAGNIVGVVDSNGPPS